MRLLTAVARPVLRLLLAVVRILLTVLKARLLRWAVAARLLLLLRLAVALVVTAVLGRDRWCAVAIILRLGRRVLTVLRVALATLGVIWRMLVVWVRHY